MGVFEHCPDPESKMRKFGRALKLSGVLLFTVPFFWPLHNAPYDESRYAPFSLKRHLGNFVFTQIEMKANTGWDASLARILGLWVGRRPMNARVRRVPTRVFAPFVK